MRRSTVRAPLSDRALVLGSRSTGLGTVVQEPRAGFYVAEWRAFCHTARLQNRLLRLKLVLSDRTRQKVNASEWCALRQCLDHTNIVFAKDLVGSLVKGKDANNSRF